MDENSTETLNNEDTPQETTPQTQERALPDGVLALDGYTPHLTFPILRSDAKDWSVYGRCTSEIPDRHGTIFSYEGAKAAFARWKGNIREQHDHKKAVGKRIEYEFNDEEKGVYLLARVSKGAPDTWEKVLDGTLNDFSVNIIPAEQYGTNPRAWPKKEYNGKMYPYLPDYDYAEISLVDSGSAPGSQFTPIVRSDGTATEVLALAEDEPETPPQALTRAGARVSSDTRTANHKSIGHTLRAATSQMQNCGDDCPQCAAAMKMIDPDADGDIDLGGYDDPDSDWQSLYSSGSTSTSDDMERAVVGMVERALQPVYARLQGIASLFARNNPGMPTQNTDSFESLITSAITRAVEGVNTAHATSLSEVRADLSAVKETVARIDATPLPGAPVMNTGAIPRPQAIDKRLATDPAPDFYTRPQSSGSAVADAMEKLYKSGQISTFDQQMEALTTGLILQQQEKARR